MEAHVDRCLNSDLNRWHCQVAPQVTAVRELGSLRLAAGTEAYERGRIECGANAVSLPGSSTETLVSARYDRAIWQVLGARGQGSYTSSGVLLAPPKSAVVNRSFRCLTGGVAVSAYDLGALPVPDPTTVHRWEGLSDRDLSDAIDAAYRPRRAASARPPVSAVSVAPSPCVAAR